MPSLKSYSTPGLDMSTLSAISLGSSSPMSLPPTSAPSVSPLAISSSPKTVNMNLWRNKAKVSPPSLQLPSSRLKATLSARDMDLEMEFLGLEAQASNNQPQLLMDEISRLASSPSLFSCRTGELKHTNLIDMFGSLNHALIPQLLMPSRPSTPATQFQSSTGIQVHQNANLLCNSYPASAASKPAHSFGFDSSSAVATAIMNPRSSTFAKRSPSFIYQGAVNVAMMMMSNLSYWGSPDGKLDWGVQGDELNKLRKSASLRLKSSNASSAIHPVPAHEPDISWVGSLVKDDSAADDGIFIELNPKCIYKKTMAYYMMQPWVDQMYREPERMAA